jgi:hypothetical protein
MPGNTMIAGISNLRNAARTMPFCASLMLLAARPRWMMYWLKPQYDTFITHMPPSSTASPGNAL